MTVKNQEFLQKRPIIVVGAGPVGLTAALALRHLNLPVTVLEAEPEGRERPGSRAIFTHKASLAALEAISPGLGFALARDGIVWSTKRTYFRGREVYVKHYPVPDPELLPPFSSLPQVRIEAHMYAAAINAGVEFIWDARVSDASVRHDHVTLTTNHGTWEADYIIAADGARSVMRKAMGVRMVGSRSANTFIVIDVAEHPARPLAPERIFHYQHPQMGHRNVLLVPFAGGWRIDLQLFATDRAEHYGSHEGVKGWIPRVMPALYAERVTWISSYQFLQVVAARFTDPHHRVALVGEAAHLFAPFGARGMNSGVIDAIEAAEAIQSAVATDRDAEAGAAMERFDARRRAAALYNRDAAGTALEHLQGRAATTALKRHLAAWAAPLWPRAGRWLDEGPYGPKSGPPQLSTKY